MHLNIFLDHLGANWEIIQKHSVVTDYWPLVQTLFCICIDVVFYPKVKFFTLKFCFFRSFIKLPTFSDISTLSTFLFYWRLSPENKVALNIRVLLSWHNNYLETRELFWHWCYSQKYIFQQSQSPTFQNFSHWTRWTIVPNFKTNRLECIQLIINKMILENCKKRKRNLRCAWIDKKAFDSAPHE